MSIQGDGNQIHLGEEGYQNAYANTSVTISSPKGDLTVGGIRLEDLLKSGDGVEVLFSLNNEEFSFYIGEETPLYQKLQELQDKPDTAEIKNTAATVLVYKNIATMLAVADVAKPIIAQFFDQSGSTVEIFNEGEGPLENIELPTKISENIAHTSSEKIKTTYQGEKKTRSASDQLKYLGTTAKVNSILDKVRKANRFGTSNPPLTQKNLEIHNAATRQEVQQRKISTAASVRDVQSVVSSAETEKRTPIGNQVQNSPYVDEGTFQEGSKTSSTTSETITSTKILEERDRVRQENHNQLLPNQEEIQEAVNVLNEIRNTGLGANSKTYFYLKNKLQSRKHRLLFSPHEQDTKEQTIQAMRQDIVNLNKTIKNPLLQNALKNLEQELNQAELTSSSPLLTPHDHTREVDSLAMPSKSKENLLTKAIDDPINRESESPLRKVQEQRPLQSISSKEAQAEPLPMDTTILVKSQQDDQTAKTAASTIQEDTTLGSINGRPPAEIPTSSQVQPRFSKLAVDKFGRLVKETSWGVQSLLLRPLQQHLEIPAGQGGSLTNRNMTHLASSALAFLQGENPVEKDEEAEALAQQIVQEIARNTPEAVRTEEQIRDVRTLVKMQKRGNNNLAKQRLLSERVTPIVSTPLVPQTQAETVAKLVGQVGPLALRMVKRLPR